MLSNINLATLGIKNPVPSVFIMMAGISEDSCQDAVQWIINANMADDEDKPEVLTLFICSPGGELHPAMALIDVMRGSTIPIQTIGLGQIASAGILIFMAGTKGMRILTENTSIMSHRYSWGSGGKSHELLAAVKEFDLTTNRMSKLYQKFTGLSEEEVNKYLLPPEDVYLSAEEAVKYGIADLIKDLK